jgi:hypothetical protein
MGLRIRPSKGSLAVKYLPFLKALHKTIIKKDKRQFRKLLRSASGSEILALAEAASNLIHGQFSSHLNKRKLDRLRSYKRGLRLLANKKITSLKKKDIFFANKSVARSHLYLR